MYHLLTYFSIIKKMKYSSSKANLKRYCAKLKLLHLKFKYYSVLLLAPCFWGVFFVYA